MVGRKSWRRDGPALDQMLIRTTGLYFISKRDIMSVAPDFYAAVQRFQALPPALRTNPTNITLPI
jgi:hypothetical protein